MGYMIAVFKKYIAALDPVVLRIAAVSLIVKLLLLLVILLRLGTPGLVNIIDDGQTYQDIAFNVLHGNGYSMTHEAPYIEDAIRVPVVPYLMVASISLTGSVFAFCVLGIFIGVIQIVAAWKIGEALGLRRRYLLVGVLLYAFEPAGLMISVLAISEPLFTTFFLFSLWGVIRIARRPAPAVSVVVVGLMLGLTALTRPIGLYAAIIAILWLMCVLPSARRVHALIVLIVFVLCVTPWFLRNERTFGVVAFSSGGIQNVFLHFGATVLAIRDNVSVSSTTEAQYERAQQLSGFSQRQVAYQDLRLNTLLKKEAMRIVIENPAATLKATAYTQVAFFTNDSYRFYYLNRLFGFVYNSSFNPTLAVFQDPIHALPQIFVQLRKEFFVSLVGRGIAVFISVFGLAGIGVSLFRSEYRANALLLGLMIAYFAVASATGGYGVTVRYRYPIEALLCLGAAVLFQTVAWYYATHAKNESAKV